jgi:N-formylglutamate deformylase
MRGDAPLIVSMPHTGTDIPTEIEQRLVSPWLARKDADWWIDKLYDFAPDLGATVDAHHDFAHRDRREPRSVRQIALSRTGTTELCPTTTFDGEPLYRDGHVPNEPRSPAANALLRSLSCRAQCRDRAAARLHERSCCSTRIRSARASRACSTASCRISTSEPTAARVARRTHQVRRIHLRHDKLFSRVTNGRFKGGYTTRHYGQPQAASTPFSSSSHARGYMDEPKIPSPENWPTV